MAITVSAAYQRELDKGSKQPILVFRFDEWPASRYTTHWVNVLTAAQQVEIMRMPSSMDFNMEPGSGKANRSKLTLLLENVDGQVEELLRDKIVLQKRGTLYAGFNEIPGDEWEPLFYGEVTGIRRDSDGQTWRFELTDPLTMLEDTIMAKDDIEGEGDPTWDQDTDWVDVEYDEQYRFRIREWDAKSSEDLEKKVHIIDNPFKIALKMLTSTGAGTNGDYDVYPLWAGLGLDATGDDAVIDIAKWEQEIDEAGALYMCKFIIDDEINVLEFIEQEICRVFGAHVYMRGDGKIALRIYRPPLPVELSSLVVMGDDQIDGIPSWDMNAPSLITHVEFHVDYGENRQRGGFGRKYGPWVSLRGVGAPFGIERYRREKKIKIESQGLKTRYGGISQARTIADMLFRRFHDPCPRVELDTMWRYHTIEPGDHVACDHTHYPDVEFGNALGVGGTRYLEVLSRKIAFGQKVTLKLLDVGWNIAGTRIACITEDSYATDYVSGNKDYGYLCDVADDEMSNGDPPYYHA